MKVVTFDFKSIESPLHKKRFVITLHFT